MKTPFLTAYIIIIGIFPGCRKDEIETNVTPEPKWKHYNQSNAPLPDNQINAIAITDNNIKWIGTADGLVQINNSAWTVYNKTNSYLPSTYIQALCTPNDTTIVVGTNSGLSVYDGHTWQTFTTENSIMTNNSVSAITYNNTLEQLWVATESDLILIESTGDWKRFDEIEDELVLSMSTASDGSLWLATFNHFSFRGKVRRFSNNQWTSYNLEQLGYPSAFPYAIKISGNNQVAVAISGTSAKNVILFENNDWIELNGPTNAKGLRCMIYHQNNWWVGGNALYTFGNNDFRTFEPPVGQIQIRAIEQDTKMNLWLGTLNVGILVFKPD